MSIPVSYPNLQVKLFKLVDRNDGVASRYSGFDREIDLTPYLGDAGTVQTVKSIHEPCGCFSVPFADHPHPGLQDSLYAIIEPMDMIEIRASRTPSRYAGGTLPLIMRGLVSDVRRAESMGAEGTPERVVVVSGQDFGKLWMIHQVWFEIAYLQDIPFLTTFRLQAATGIEAAMLPVSEFMTQVVNRVMNEKVRQLSAFADRRVNPFRIDATVTEGVVTPYNAAPYQGPLWNLLEQFADRPWNELFIEDEEDGPVLRYRPAPFKDIGGDLILPGAVDPGAAVFDEKVVLSWDVTRSDSRVANFFWVPPGTSMLNTGQWVNIASKRSSDPFDFAHGNNKPDLYGLKKMQVATSLLPSDIAGVPIRLSKDERGQALDKVGLWHQLRAQQLKEMNRDNAVFEEGTAKLVGSEVLRPGRYMRLHRGELVTEAYMTRVAHNIAPLRGWTSTVTFARGTGFLERNRYGGSVFQAEGRRGPYTP